MAETNNDVSNVRNMRWTGMLKVLLVAVLFGLAIRLTMWFGLFIPIPGSGMQMDLREILVILGSSLTGPLGGLVLGFLTGLGSNFSWFPTLAHMVVGCWSGWIYVKFVSRRTSTVGMVASWAGLVTSYYYLVYIPFIVLGYVAVPALTTKPPQAGTGIADILLFVAKAISPEFVFTLLSTTAILLMVPLRFRQPLWLSSKEVAARESVASVKAASGVAHEHRGYLGFRLMAWFLLLSLVPLVIASMFVQGSVSSALLGAEGGRQREVARIMAKEIRRVGVEHAREVLSMYGASSQAVFVLDTTGRYIAHIDSAKEERNVAEDFPLILVVKMLKGKTGIGLDDQSTLAIGYAPIPGQSYRVIAVQGRKMVNHALVDLQETINTRLGASLLIISLVGGLVIWVLVGRPMKKLTVASQMVGRGDFSAVVNTAELEDEIRMLGQSFNEMTQNLRQLHLEMEAEIAQRKATEETLREREKQFRLLAENSTDMISRHDLQGRYLYVSPACRLLLGYEPEELVGHSVYDLIHPEDLVSVAAHHQRQVEERISPPIVYRLLRKDKSSIWFESTTRLVGDQTTDESSEIHVSSRDVTQRMVTELALKESEERLRSVVSNVPVVLYSLNKDGVFTLSEGKGLEKLGLKPGEVVGMPITKVYGDYPDIIAGNRRALAGEPTHQTLTMGSLVLDAWYTPMRDSAGIVSGVIGVAIDVTDRKRAEDAVRESERMHKTLIEQSTDPIYVIQDNRLVFVNRAWEETFGFSNAEAMSDGFNLLSIVGPESRAIVAERLNRYSTSGSAAPRYEMRGMRFDGTFLDLDVSIAKIDWKGKPAIQGIYRDITERKKGEEAIRQSQKTESLGILAGGIAHDFNNLLQAMLGQTSLALTRLPQGSPAYNNVAKAESAAQRAAELTRQLLAYSGRGKFDVRPIDLNALIHENLHFLELAIPKGVTLQENLAADLPLINADAGQIQQVVMNLIINASEAIGERAGQILLRTSVETILPEQIDQWTRVTGSLTSGQVVQLEVSDNGVGMTPETLRKIFDPFFTTKVTGRGLGLSAVIGIVKGHFGGLRVESEAGHRTTFKIVFPVSSETRDATASASRTAHPAKYEGCVLIVDDEPDVRQVVTDMLEDVGVRILVAENGEEGLELYRSKWSEIDLVLLDLSMPGMGGKETFKRMKAINANAKVVLTSGYSETEVTDDLKALGLTGFIQKPYRYDRLKDTIVRYIIGHESA